MAVSVADEQPRPVDVEDLAALARHVLRARDVPERMELTLLLVERDRIAALNEQHLGVEGPTDVLAFPIDVPDEVPAGAPGVLGDVVVCPAVAGEQAGGHGRSEHGELQLLVVHGILHLLGMDHAAPEEEREMFALTDRLLAAYREERDQQAVR